MRARQHVGKCSPNTEIVEQYRQYCDTIRKRAAEMKRVDLERAAEFHRVAWKIYRSEYNAR